MPNPVQFLVTNRLTRNTGQLIFVFLTSRRSGDSGTLSLPAWQVLTPAANGGRQAFTYSPQLQLTVQDERTGCLSETRSVRPNQLYSVTNEDHQGPVLRLSNSVPPSSRAVGVKNTTDPKICLRTVWSVQNKAVLFEDNLNFDSTALFQLEPTLFFLVANPIRGGGGWKLQQFSEEFVFVLPETENDGLTQRAQGYRAPPGIRQVRVSWSRPGGRCGADTLTFDPPSASTDSQLLSDRGL